MEDTLETQHTAETTPADNARNEHAQTFVRRRKISRMLAVQFLYQADLQDKWDFDWKEMADFRYLAENAYDDEDDYENRIDSADMNGAWAYTDALIKGTVPKREELDAFIAEAAANWSLRRMSYTDRAILRLAVFEIVTGINKVTPAIAINEAVELAKLFSEVDSPRFVNGVLDKVRRIVQQKAQTQEVE